MGEKDKGRRKDDQKKAEGGQVWRQERMKIRRIQEKPAKPSQHTTKIQAPNQNLILSFSLVQQIADIFLEDLLGVHQS